MRTKTTAAALAAITLIGLTGCSSSPKEPTITAQHIGDLNNSTEEQIAARCGALLGDASTFVHYATGKEDKTAQWQGKNYVDDVECTPNMKDQTETLPTIYFYFTAYSAAEMKSDEAKYGRISATGKTHDDHVIHVQAKKAYGKLDEAKTKALLEKIANSVMY